MLLMNAPELSAFRFLGGLGSMFSTIQSAIWFCLSLAGAFCKYAACGSKADKGTFKYCFYLIYYYTGDKDAKTSESLRRLNYISPWVFHFMMWFSIFMCLANFLISLYTAKVFMKWNDAFGVKKMAVMWTKTIMIISAIEFIFCVMFACDIVAIKQSNETSCFLKKDLTKLLSSDVRSPAPYLLNLKSNLKTMKKKIRKLKRNLLMLDAIFDDKSPDHIENPFISKEVVNNYVDVIWKDMFNTSIREKVQRRANRMPFDDVMRKFVINEHLFLDDIDFDLLKNFDDLTSNKYLKPLESSNAVFGKKINLSPSISVDHSTKIEKMINLLSEYVKETGKKKHRTNNEITEENFDDFLKTLLDELEKKDTNFSQNIKHQDALLHLTNFLDEKPVGRWIKGGNNRTNLLNKRRKFLKKPTSKFLREMVVRRKTIRKVGKGASAKYLKDLCDNCAYFVSSPSIFLMVLSLKTGLVWLLNIIFGVLLGFYNAKTEVILKNVSEKVEETQPIKEA